MRENSIRRATPERVESHLVSLAKSATASFEAVERELRGRIATLEAQGSLNRAAIDVVSQGVCLFDAEERLILCNRRYAEIYQLAPGKSPPRATLREMVELRFAAATPAAANAACLAAIQSKSSSVDSRTWTANLKDGRTIQIHQRPIAEGGWIETHEDVSELTATRAAVQRCILMQALIDRAPDYMWVKDVESRFIVVNKALASDSGRADPNEMLGLNDFDLHDPESAQKFRATEEGLLRTGQPIVGREEAVVTSSGVTKWLSSIKEPLRNEKNQIVGLVGIARDVTELKATRSVASERLSIQALIDRLPDNLWVKDVDSRFIIANNVTATRMGLAGTADLIGRTDLELLSPDIATRFFADEQAIIRSGRPMADMVECVFGASGKKTWILTTKVPWLNDKNETVGILGISRDITERKLAEDLRAGQAQILEMIAMSVPLQQVLERLVHLVELQLTGIYGSVLLLDDDGLHLRLGAAPSLAGAYVRAIDGMSVGPSGGSCGAAVFRREVVIVKDIQDDPLWQDNCELAAAHGYRSCWSTPIVSHQGAVLGTFALYSATVRAPTEVEVGLIDVATRIVSIAIERKQAEDRIHFMANHDALTGLPNRALLKDRLTQALLYAQRYDRSATVVFIDLDNFKIVNDSLGHNAGDALLKTVANRMVDCVRATDTVVRLGGDEFVVLLLDQPKSADIVSATVQKLAAAVACPVQVEGHELRVTGSIGIATYPGDGADADTLLANADAAMYRAKQTGRDNFQFYTPALNTKAHERFALQEQLRNAVARCEFVLFYQPQVDLRSGRVIGVEALIRWKHPVLGIVPPIKFIPMAEESGLIVQIGNWVLREACRQNKAWQEAGLPPVSVCVNVSARQFSDKNLIAYVVKALQDSGLEAKYLELELTESLIMKDVAQAITTMNELQGLGVQLSIDDFGTGYSSLSALKSFPVARLKIDKSFISELPYNENDTAIASAVISLGQKLNMRVIAEGVETEGQLAFLREHNCDEMQGYHFSRPLSAQQLGELLIAVAKN